jgi:alanine dehydrogenase
LEKGFIEAICLLHSKNRHRVKGRLQTRPPSSPTKKKHEEPTCTLPYALQIANLGYEKAIRENAAIAKGLNVIKGDVVHKAVAESLGLPYVPLA